MSSNCPTGCRARQISSLVHISGKFVMKNDVALPLKLSSHRGDEDPGFAFGRKNTFAIFNNTISTISKPENFNCLLKKAVAIGEVEAIAKTVDPPHVSTDSSWFYLSFGLEEMEKEIDDPVPISLLSTAPLPLQLRSPCCSSPLLLACFLPPQLPTSDARCSSRPRLCLTRFERGIFQSFRVPVLLTSAAPVLCAHRLTDRVGWVEKKNRIAMERYLKRKVPTEGQASAGPSSYLCALVDFSCKMTIS
ncbi:hypothetical protein LXL04_000543 [Taraxacum kok-saghyz]